MNLWKDRNWSPMLLKEIPKPFDSKDYIFELKFDGIRAIIFASPKGIQIKSRNNKDLTDLFPELDSIKDNVKNSVIFDGEIVSMDGFRPSFAKLQKRLHIKNKRKIIRESTNDPVCFVAFDILYQNQSLIDKPLIERKKTLETYADTDVFIKSKIFASGIKLFKEVKKYNLEGIVAKSKEGTYHPDDRTDDFIKIKNIQRGTFVIGGYTKNTGSSTISLALGEELGPDIHYVGKVIIGPKEPLYPKIIKSPQTKKCPFSEDLDGITYIKPTFSCTVEYLEKTKNGHLRHPVFKGEYKSYEQFKNI